MIWQRVPASILMMAVAAFLWRFPVAQPWLAIGFAAYAMLLLKYPRAWLIVVPASMPVLDLATISGWFFFDAFDALVLLTAATLLWRHRLYRGDFVLGRPLAIVLALLVASYVISAGIVLIPWPAIDGNAFASYYSPFNAARVAKGFLWPLLLLPYLIQALNTSANTGRYLAGGLLLGLLGVALVGLYEHWLFVGLFNFDQEYRIVGPFSSMHTGDGHIDLWLAVTMPLIVAPFIWHLAAGWRLAALGLSGPAFYVLLATASRGPFLAVAVAFFAMLGSVVYCRARRGRLARTLVPSAMAVALLAVAAVPFAVPTELGSRFKQTGRDFHTRLAHFQNVLAMRDKGAETELFGMGLGSYPRTYARRHLGARPPASYSFDGTGRQRYLTLRSGDNLYFGQKIDAAPRTRYRLSFVYRTRDPRARLTVSICEKWLLHSRRCSWNSYALPPTGGTWVQYGAAIKTNDVGRPRGRVGNLSKQPIQFALHTARATAGLSLDDIAFVAPDGRNLLKNGDFNHGNDHWFWTVDNHLPWHTKNMAVNVLFDQGWLGLAGVSLLFWLGLVTLARAILDGRSDAIPWLGAMTGYVAAAVVVSPFDQPRLAMLFYLMCLFCTLRFSRGAR